MEMLHSDGGICHTYLSEEEAETKSQQDSGLKVLPVPAVGEMIPSWPLGFRGVALALLFPKKAPRVWPSPLIGQDQS